jgi:hypothetical protein
MKQAIEVNRPYLRDQKFAAARRGRQVAAATAPQKWGLSYVAPAPLKLLPDYAEEGCVGQ